MYTLFILGVTTLTYAYTPEQATFFAPYLNNTPPIHAVSDEQWAALNASLDGRLYPGVPFSRPCFSRFEKKDVAVEKEQCTWVRVNYRNESARTGHPAGQINTQWETCQSRGESCLLDYGDTFDQTAVRSPNQCHLGSVSNYYVDVRKPLDVRIALEFSRETYVPLVIKNTGHDYKGRSSAPFSLALWTHNLQKITYHPEYTPTDCTAQFPHPVPAVTLGAGVQWYQAYAFAEEHNITIVGGADRTVGTTGGWLQGGGHGALTNTMGMGVDRVLEFVVVTPDGETRVVNACQNGDLFFALRGGGGGTFAVVISATVLASPRLTIQAVLVQFPAPGSNSATSHSPHPAAAINGTHDLRGYTREMWTILLDNALRWAGEGWGGYVNANSALYINSVMRKEEARQSMEPLITFGERLKEEAGGGNGIVVVQGEYDSWAHFFDLFADGNSADLGEPLALASCLVPSSSLTTPESRSTLLAALLEAESITPGLRILKTTPFNYPGFSPNISGDSDAPAPVYVPPGPTSLNPAWRTAVYHITVVTPWNWNATRVEIEQRYATASRAMDVVRSVTRGRDGVGAAYVNEADVYELNHEQTFWGEHFPRLLEIKNKYDPDRLLDCWQCVGWLPDSPRFSCYV